MDVKFPILGFLMEAEATGYDLKQRFQDPVGFFYRVSDGSIYPALKKLARDGLVKLRTERRGRRARKVYAITPRGRAHFRRMLREPAQPLFVFDESQVKIYFADHEPEIALEHMERIAARRRGADTAYSGRDGGRDAARGRKSGATESWSSLAARLSMPRRGCWRGFARSCGVKYRRGGRSAGKSLY